MMSEAEQFDPQMLRPPPGVWRPPGVWPPPPPTWPPGPPMVRPPDFLSWFFWLNQNYDDVKQAREFFKRILSDLLQDDPGLLASAQALVGVTDGSDAQPGMVGEFIRLQQNVAFPAGQNTQIVALGTLPPGDWDCWLWHQATQRLTFAQAYLNPQPAGFSDLLNAYIGTDVGEQTLVPAPAVRALTTVPSLIALTVTTDTAGGAAGELSVTFSARRRR